MGTSPGDCWGTVWIFGVWGVGVWADADSSYTATDAYSMALRSFLTYGGYRT